jgi:hypothetical protein
MEKKFGKAFIFDLDGVLQDPSLRIDMWNDKHYERFNSVADLDDPIEETVELCKVLMEYEDYQIIFLTGRTENYREGTLAWLAENVFDPEECGNFSLIMRPESVKISDADFKKQAYLEKIEPLYQVIGVFEDRTPVVNMWRELGLVCYALPTIFDRDKKCSGDCNCRTKNIANFAVTMIEITEQELDMIKAKRKEEEDDEQC